MLHKNLLGMLGRFDAQPEKRNGANQAPMSHSKYGAVVRSLGKKGHRYRFLSERVRSRCMLT